MDLRIRSRYGIALDETVLTDGDDLLGTLHAIVIVKEFYDWILFTVGLICELDLAYELASPMLSHLYHTVIEADGETHLSVDLEIHACYRGHLCALLLLPKALAGVVDTVCAIRKGVAENILLDDLQIHDLCLLVNVEYQLSTLEDANSKVVGAYNELVVRIDT